MKLYIDTNIYLSYINSTGDIKVLRNLKKLIDNKKVEVVLPSQTKKEYLRNFKSRVLQEYDKLKKAKAQVIIPIPNDLKSKEGQKTTEEIAIIKQIDALNINLKKYRIQKISNFKRHIEIAEKEIEGILRSAISFEYTDEVILKAIARYAKDLPPKKDNQKFGDAIIWETLKDSIRTEDLVIISFDSDFSEKTKNKSINKILLAEWKKHSKKNLTLYPLLGEFVNTLYKEDPVSKETIQKEKIRAEEYLNSTALIYKPLTDSNGMSWATGISGTNTLGIGYTTSSVLNLVSDKITSGVLTENNSLYGTGIGAVTVGGGGISQVDLISGSSGVYTLSNKVCSGCKKRYNQSLTRVNINNLCDDCDSIGGANIWLPNI